MIQATLVGYKKDFSPRLKLSGWHITRRNSFVSNTPQPSLKIRPTSARKISFSWLAETFLLPFLLHCQQVEFFAYNPPAFQPVSLGHRPLL